METIVAPAHGMAEARVTAMPPLVDHRGSRALAVADLAQDVIILDLGRLDLSMREMIVWLRAVQQRGTPAAVHPNVTIGDMRINLGAKSVTNSTGQRIRLTPTEWQLLEQLLRRPGEVVRRDTLLTALRGGVEYNDPSYLRVYMAQLRRKLEPEPRRPRYLVTEHGLGYRFQPSVAQDAPQSARRLPSTNGREASYGRADARSRRRPCRRA